MRLDLTQGRVMPQLVRFAFPIFLANLLQSLYNIADLFVVGRFLGSSGLAALSSAVMLCYIITALCAGITTGGSVLVAQYQGAGDLRARQKAVGALFTLSGLTAAGITLGSLLLYGPILRAMSVPAGSLAMSMDYMHIISLGTVFVLGYNAVCAVLRGMGDSQSPLVFVAIATVLNILLDLLLVGPLGLGAAGAALATVLAQGLSFLVALVTLRRRGFLSGFAPRDLAPDLPLWRTLLRLGIPTAVQLSIVNLSYLLVTGMFNTYGTAIAAAAGVGLKLNTMAAMPCWAVGQAVTTMAGQCMGHQDARRAGATARAGLVLALSVSGAVAVAVFLFAPQLIALFDPSPAVVAAGTTYLRICCSVNFLAYAAMYVLDSFATGVGCPTLAMVNALVHSLPLRLGLSWLFSVALDMGFLGLCWAEMAAPFPCALVALLFFRRGTWKTKRII